MHGSRLCLYFFYLQELLPGVGENVLRVMTPSDVIELIFFWNSALVLSFQMTSNSYKHFKHLTRSVCGAAVMGSVISNNLKLPQLPHHIAMVFSFFYYLVDTARVSFKILSAFLERVRDACGFVNDSSIPAGKNGSAANASRSKS